MQEREIVLKEKYKFCKIKNNCYDQIVSCENRKVRRDSLVNIEIVERIGLRGIKSIVTKENKVELEVGYKTNNTILENILLPIAKRYNLPRNVISELESLIQPKYKKGFKRNMSRTTKELHEYGKNFLKKSDTYGFLKAESFSNDIRYAIASIGERKCIAYENKLKRIERSKSRECA